MSLKEQLVELRKVQFDVLQNYDFEKLGEVNKKIYAIRQQRIAEKKIEKERAREAEIAKKIDKVLELEMVL